MAKELMIKRDAATQAPLVHLIPLWKTSEPLKGKASRVAISKQTVETHRSKIAARILPVRQNFNIELFFLTEFWMARFTFVFHWLSPDVSQISWIGTHKQRPYAQGKEKKNWKKYRDEILKQNLYHFKMFILMQQRN